MVSTQARVTVICGDIGIGEMKGRGTGGEVEIPHPPGTASSKPRAATRPTAR